MSTPTLDWGVPRYFEGGRRFRDYSLFETGNATQPGAGRGSADYVGLVRSIAPHSTEMTSKRRSDECEEQFMTVSLSRLKHRHLKIPLSVIVEPDDDGFIAKTPELPLYGYGEDRDEAIDNLKIEIESLYADLMQDDNFTEEWIQIKAFLKERVVN